MGCVNKRATLVQPNCLQRQREKSVGSLDRRRNHFDASASLPVARWCDTSEPLSPHGCINLISRKKWVNSPNPSMDMNLLAAS